ncbi:MAG TPA: KTSC domain-containing protein [Burkholderiales bacterium]|nr:KTSC domain-containing protein [Burkholderiales bacterium]
MERKSVNSGSIRSVGYEAREQFLKIEFTHGGIYQYSRVSWEIYRRLMVAPAMASYFKDVIEEGYSVKRIR